MLSAARCRGGVALSRGHGATAFRRPDQPGRVVRPARLADRPGAAARPLPAARTRDRAVEDRSAVPGRGPGRRHAGRNPRPGAGRARHHHRRRAAPRELLEPICDRARRRRHRQPGDGARPQRPPQPGAARGRADRAKAPGAGAGRGVPAVAHQPAGQDHRAGTVHDVTAGAERRLPDRGGAGRGVRCRRARRDRRPVRRRRRHRPDRRALHAGAAGEGAGVRAGRSWSGRWTG